MDPHLIDHIGILVPNLEEAISRWAAATGYHFSPITRYRTARYIDSSNPSPHPHDARRSSSLEGPPRIELLEMTGSGTHGPKELGVHHIGIRGFVDNEARLEELRDAGFEENGRSIGQNGELLLFFTEKSALDGLRIESISVVPGPMVSDDGRRLPIDPSTGRADIWAQPLDD